MSVEYKEIIIKLLLIGRSLENKLNKLNETFDQSGLTFLDDEISGIADIIFDNLIKKNNDIKDVIYECMETNMSVEDCIKRIWEESE